jgi:hypothetical protein
VAFYFYERLRADGWFRTTRMRRNDERSSDLFLRDIILGICGSGERERWMARDRSSRQHSTLCLQKITQQGKIKTKMLSVHHGAPYRK